MTHSFVHSTFFFFFWCLLCQVPALKELKAIQETYPRQPAESRALGKRWRPGKGRGSAERRGESPPQANLADFTGCSLPVDRYLFLLCL